MIRGYVDKGKIDWVLDTHYIVRMSKVTEVAMDVAIKVKSKKTRVTLKPETVTEKPETVTEKPAEEAVTEKPETVTEKPAEEAAIKKKTVKTKVDKYNGFKVPNKDILSTRWAIHVYNMIKEAREELLQREDVRVAYNNLVEGLLKYDGLLQSYIPTKYSKYNTAIDLLKRGIEIFHCHPFRWIYDNDFTIPNRNEIVRKRQEFRVEFEKFYTPLFDLIKRDVIPYMELKQHEINSKWKIQGFHYRMGKIEKTIKMYESRIADLYKEMGELSAEVIKCNEPPPLTVFE